MYREREKRPPVPHPSAEAEHLTKSEGANQNPRDFGRQPKIRFSTVLKISLCKQCPAIGGMKRKSSSRLGHKLLINRFCCGIKHFTEQNTAAVFSTVNKTVYKAEQDCTKVNLEVLFQIHMLVAET